MHRTKLLNWITEDKGNPANAQSFILSEIAIADLVLAAHPSGFSTTRGDLIRDILPGI